MMNLILTMFAANEKNDHKYNKYYSSSDIVFNRVKLNFFIIFLNSLLKSIILTLLFIWAFNKYLTKPLENITKNVQKVNLDKLSSHKPIPIQEKQNNELSFLAQAFNTMLKDLDNKLHTIKDTQKHLLQSEKMVALGSMVAGVSHEINTPVGMALTGITHLEEQTKDLQKLYDNENMSQDEFEEYLKDVANLSNAIEINLNKAASLVNSFKKVAVDQSSDESREFNLKNYIDEILLSIHNHTKKTNISITINIDRDINIYSNPGSLSQIITNLVMNSLIHGFNNSTTIKGNISIDAKLNNQILYIVYKDDGKGLNEEARKKIFNPFFTTTRNSGGSGLGMSIIYNIITSALYGSIKLKSKLNQGIIFNIEIPIQAKG